jgi:hypothetical protein
VFVQYMQTRVPSGLHSKGRLLSLPTKLYYVGSEFDILQ